MSTDHAVAAQAAGVLHFGMAFRGYAYTAALAALAAVLFLIRLWQPETQLRKHSDHLLRALADKNWKTFAGLIADDYHDQWGNDRTAVLDRTREIFGYLRQVKINAGDPMITTASGQGRWIAKVTIEGNEDNEVMNAVKDKVNNLPSPFELEWKKMSGKPWDWKLVAVRNAELVIPAEY